MPMTTQFTPIIVSIISNKFFLITLGIGTGLLLSKFLSLYFKKFASIKAKKKRPYVLPPYIRQMESLPLNKLNDLINDDGHLLDIPQKEALTSAFKETLVLAGAGAGKTAVLTKRVFLFHKILNIDIRSILVMAFNKDAAENARIKIGKSCNIKSNLLNKNIRTMHSLALEVYQRGTGSNIDLKEDDNSELKNVISEVIKEMKSGYDFKTYFESIINFFGPKKINGDVKNLKSSVNLKDGYKCSDGLIVPTEEEKKIVETLLEKRINYKYRPLANWADQYFSPFLFLPDLEIYIEYWDGYKINDPIMRADYLKEVKFCKTQYWKYNFFCIDIYPIFKGPIKDQLLSKLGNIDKTKIRPFKKQLEYNFNFFESELNKILLEILTVLTAYEKKFNDILNNIDDKTRQVINFIKPFFDKLELKMKENGMLTFTLLLKYAVTLLSTNPKLLNEYRDRFKHIFVDEVQDLQPLTRKFIRLLVGDEQSLFAIGDDYQSIYSFAGSDPEFTMKFNEYFPSATQIKLRQNFRCHPKIVDISNHVIRFNKNQIHKDILVNYNDKNKSTDKVATVLYISNPPEKSNPQIINYLKEHLPQGSKLQILARYNKIQKEFKDALPKNHFEINPLSIHKSKGLEEDNVIILGCNETPDGKHCFPAKDQCFSVKDKVSRICRGPNFDLLEEENRLFYVALTRAKKRLFIVAQKGMESRFVNNYLPKELVEKVWL